MPAQACQFVDLHPCQLEALELGARAIIWAPRGPWNEISRQVDEVLSPQQLVDLARWARNFFLESGCVSDVHDIFWERGASFGVTFSASQDAQAQWKRVHAPVAGTCEYVSRMMVRREGWAMKLVVSDVYRCSGHMELDKEAEELNENDWLDISNILGDMSHVAHLLLDAQETEERHGPMFV
jgi:hypothetical protein